MALLTFARYQALTGDRAGVQDAVEATIDLIENEVSRFLRRPLEFGTYTEVLPVHAGNLAFPRATPLLSVPASATYQYEDEVTLRYVWPDSLSDFIGGPIGPADVQEWEDSGGVDPYTHGYRELGPRGATVTYSGGWTDATVPLAVLRHIARAVYALSNPSGMTSSIPVGASSASMGDASVTFDGGYIASVEELDTLSPGASKALWMYRWKDGSA